MQFVKLIDNFKKEILFVALKDKNIEYSHFPKLGGRRKSSNTIDYDFVKGWRNISFKNYASYTMTGEYENGIMELINESKEKTVCIMCAEAVPWRCHRLLISNTLVTKGIEVFHILGIKKCEEHKINRYGAFAELYGGKIIYP